MTHSTTQLNDDDGPLLYLLIFFMVLIFFSGICWMFCCGTCVGRDLLKFCCRTTWFLPKNRRNKRKKNRSRSGGIKRGSSSKHDNVPLDEEEWEMLEDGELFRDADV
ncbi:5897_t:CDS:1 [Dentiscutata heterogama]|uniref:5897_t:CDS:1 n=1 Tax=Dentiscutata heterogama TaxID=1316150 RepID=A0ACA9KG03_9GLOM|nr:5897_t:CDS:1 [Dentiscutata heterogama]